MICKVKATVKSHNMLKNGDQVIVAVSGGSDSMVLLDVLEKISSDYSLNLCVAHVNHQLRGDESLRDEMFVRDYCKQKGIECYVLQCDVANSREKGESVEEAGRRIRYDFFNSINPDAKIATAHNLSDNAETLIFNMTRGSGLKGLCAIPPCRDNIIRPLINISKSEILDYCKANNLTYVTDSTNALDCYTRNKLRHNVIPVLSEINPSFLQSVQRLIQSLSEDEAYLSAKADDIYLRAKMSNGFSVDVLKSAEKPILKRTLIRILSEACSKKPSTKNLEALLVLLYKGGTAQVTDGIFFRIRKGILEKVPNSEDVIPWSVEISGEIVEFSFGIIKIYKNVYDSTQKFKKESLADAIDYGKIIGNVKLRSRLAGDTFTSAKSGNTKTLKKLFNEFAIPPEDRNKIPIIVDDEGILWIKGFGVSKRAKCTEKTKDILLIKSED